MKKRIFVFPCGSEIALEIARSLKFNNHFELVGGSSVTDHGCYVYKEVVNDLPWQSSDDFITQIKRIVEEKNIDLIYPAMDTTIVRLKEAESYLGVPIISSPLETTKICMSKLSTYRLLSDMEIVPKTYSAEDKMNFPVFVKPDVGYGSRGALKISSQEELRSYLDKYNDVVICEFLPGEEYTVDCFTDRHRNLLFSAARIRNRVSNGISVNTSPVENQAEFQDIAKMINESISFRGAWFFQVKRNAAGKLIILEIASRLGGSSSLFRAQGVNFANLSIWDALDADVSIFSNTFALEMDRALNNKFKMDIHYSEVFLDFDDTILIDKKELNTEVMQFIFQCINANIKLSILSKHNGDLITLLKQLRIHDLFDRIIHIPMLANKGDYIDNPCSIFIDDSFAERENIFKNCNIPVFGVDAVVTLIN